MSDRTQTLSEWAKLRGEELREFQATATNATAADQYKRDAENFEAVAALLSQPERHGHRIEIEFDGDATYVKLICPESGCKPGIDPDTDEECGEDCWLIDWVGEHGLDLLHGKVKLAVTPEWDGDSARLWVDDRQPAQVAYVREQEGNVTELFATVEEAMSGPWEFEDSPMSAGDPWRAEESDPETGLCTQWIATPKGEEMVRITAMPIPPATALPAQPPAPVLSDEARERLGKLGEMLEALGCEPDQWPAFLRNLASREHRGEEQDFSEPGEGRSPGEGGGGSHAGAALLRPSEPESDRSVSTVESTSGTGGTGGADPNQPVRPEPGRLLDSTSNANARPAEAFAPEPDVDLDPMQGVGAYEAGCYSCGEPASGKCRRSKRACGHHCNCSWQHDHCHWCGKEFGEQPEGGDEEDWPEEITLGLYPSGRVYISDAPEITVKEGRPVCRYAPATSQDSSGLETAYEKARDQLDEAADKAPRLEDLSSLLKSDASPETSWTVAKELDEIADTLGALPERAVGDDSHFDRLEKRAERAETALKELAEEFEADAEAEDHLRQLAARNTETSDAGLHAIARDAHQAAASLARKKAAELSKPATERELEARDEALAAHRRKKAAELKEGGR